MAWLATLRQRLPGHCTDRGNSALAPTQSAPTSASAAAGFFGDPLQVSCRLTLRSDPCLLNPTHPTSHLSCLSKSIHDPQKLYPPRAGLPACGRKTTLQIVSILICSGAPFAACRARRFAKLWNVATALLTLPSAHAISVVQVEAS